MKKIDDAFCRAFLRTMDPERAGVEAGCLEDAFSYLDRKKIRQKLDKMRDCTAAQLRKEDALRRLAQLAFGRVNDAVSLALHPLDLNPLDLDLSPVAEFRVTDKGGVEVKMVDRIKALEALCRLLDSPDSEGAQDLYQALQNAADHLNWEDP